jgi:predicted MPP superfamily phosphohydrolase
MRTSLLFTAILLIIIVFPDWVIGHEIRKHVRKRWPVVLHWIGTAFFLVGIFTLFLFVRVSHDEDQLQLFMWFNWLLLLIYIPKLIFAVFLLLNKGIRKLLPFMHNTFAYLGLFFALIVFIGFIYGAMRGRFEVVTTHLDIPLAALPKTFDGLKIVQISDFHLGNFGNAPLFWKNIVDKVNAEKPDIIVMTGDMMNNFADEITPADIALFSQLHAPYGKFSILGNHDYGDYTRWSSPAAKKANLDSLEQRERRMGFRLLLDEHVFVVKNGDSIAVAGVQNWSKPPFHCYGNLPKAMHRIEQFPFVMLLTHDPNHWMAQAVNYPTIFLTLSGHTHAMQLGINRFGLHWSPAEWVFKQWDGLYRYETKYLYVNRGLGYVGVPIRIGMSPEISVLTLRCASK